jgi:hypothetical protein
MILDQLGFVPRSTVLETPNPQVRVQHRFAGQSGWHPDELVDGACGRRCVLVWDEPPGLSVRTVGDGFLKN